MARLIRAGDLSARETVHAHLDRIACANAKVNAIVTLTAERALEQALRDRRPVRGGGLVHHSDSQRITASFRAA